jgi:magnesium transporter
MEKLDADIKRIERKLLSLENAITDEPNLVDTNNIHTSLFKLQKIIVDTKVLFEELINDGTVAQDQIEGYRQKMENIKFGTEAVQSYYEQIMHLKQTKTTNMFTLITFIFLPLTLIVGYFGMNFNGMGSPTTKDGVFSWKYGQHFAITMMIIASITTLILVRFGIIQI